jgi:hypothetical protein
MKFSKSLTCATSPDPLFSYRDPQQRSAIGLVAKWWAEAEAQGVKNPEVWVAKRCAEDIKRAQDLIAAGRKDT